MLAPILSGNQPHDFEFIPVRISAVQGFGRAMVAFPDERAIFDQYVPRRREIFDGRYLPRQMIESRTSESRARSRGRRKQSQVVMIRGFSGAQECRLSRRF